MYQQVLPVQARIPSLDIRPVECHDVPHGFRHRKALKVSFEILIYVLAFGGGTWLYLGLSLF